MRQVGERQGCDNNPSRVVEDGAGESIGFQNNPDTPNP